jgi:hypothetical protein
MPEFAATHGTVGMYCEQAGEHVHVHLNKLDRNYCKVPNVVNQMEMMFNQFHLQTDPRHLIYEIPKRAKNQGRKKQKTKKQRRKTI